MFATRGGEEEEGGGKTPLLPPQRRMSVGVAAELLLWVKEEVKKEEADMLLPPLLLLLMLLLLLLPTNVHIQIHVNLEASPGGGGNGESHPLRPCRSALLALVSQAPMPATDAGPVFETFRTRAPAMLTSRFLLISRELKQTSGMMRKLRSV